MADLQGTRRCEDNTGEHLSNQAEFNSSLVLREADRAWISTY
jgi:hypothetical protein